jgi:RNA polymerase sigma-70 factor (ECF subfamily)
MPVILLMISEMENEDDKAFVLELYENYYALVRKTIYGITHDFKEVDDLINDTFIKLIEKVSLLRTFDCCRVASYVVFTSRSVAVNFIKHRDVQNKHTYYGEESDLADEFADQDEALELRIAHQDEIEYLCGAISKLPERQKDILYFKYILEMPDAEVAENLGISPDSVRQYLTRARRAARKLVEKEMSGYAE